jgi:hypothetical protein
MRNVIVSLGLVFILVSCSDDKTPSVRHGGSGGQPGAGAPVDRDEKTLKKPVAAEMLFLRPTTIRLGADWLEIPRTSKDNITPSLLDRFALFPRPDEPAKWMYSHHVFFVEGKRVAHYKDVFDTKKTFCALAANAPDKGRLDEWYKGGLRTATVTDGGKVIGFLNVGGPVDFELEAGFQDGFRGDWNTNTTYEYSHKQVRSLPGLLFYCARYYDKMLRPDETRKGPFTYGEAMTAVGRNLEILVP